MVWFDFTRMVTSLFWFKAAKVHGACESDERNAYELEIVHM